MELVEVKKKEVFCDSSLVAKKFKYPHAKVANLIKKEIEKLKRFSMHGVEPKCFPEEREYRGQIFTAYYMNRDFFSLLIMRFDSDRAYEWKLQFLAAFNAMEKRITLFDQNSKDPIWLKSRAMTKIARKEETDIVKKFVDYATKQGSKNAKYYYKHVTNSTYKALGLLEQKKPKLRDTMSIYEQASLVLAEKIVLDSFKKYMDLGRNYKDIYESVKEDLLKYGPGLSITQTKEENVLL